MVKYVEYAVTWLFFMAIIVGLCLITPKLAKKIDQWREAKKSKDADGNLLQPIEQEQPSVENADQPETKE